LAKYTLAGLVFLNVTDGASAVGPALARYPDVSGGGIVFTYEGDLWTTMIDGWDAWRITTDPGVERDAKYSRDGQWIAFTGQYDGNTDVYIIPPRGGVPKRLTWHPANDRVVGWMPQSRHVVFRSTREYPNRVEMIYKVSIDGGMPEKLNIDQAGLTSVSPDGNRIAYNRISREERTWKRHQGGTAQDIWLGDLTSGKARPITDWPGTDNYPMWVGDFIFFNSDREHGTLNIYRYDTKTGKTEAMTRYTDYDVKFPSAGANYVVFQREEGLHLLNVFTGDVHQIPFTIPSDGAKKRPRLESLDERVETFSLSPNGKRLLLESRGEIVSLDVKNKDAGINLTNASSTREKNPAWSPDGKWIAFHSDRSGEEELYLVDQLGANPPRQVTSGGQAFRNQPVWSPDSQWVIYSDKFLRLNLVNVETGAVSQVDQGDYDDGWENWGIQHYVWSPDSKWIAYTKLEKSGNQSVFLYSLEQRSVHRVTDEMGDDFSPSFSPDGKYLHFLGHRNFDPVMGRIDQNHVYLDVCRPYLVILEDGQPSPFVPELTIDTVEEEGESDSEEQESEADTGETRVDVEGIERRITPVPNISPGNYFRLEATENGFCYLKRDDLSFLKYQTVNDTTGAKLDLYGYDFEEQESKKKLAGINNYHLSTNGKKLVYKSGKKFGVVDTGTKADVGDGSVDLGRMKLFVVPEEEFLQIFNEAWRVQRDWFYDKNMHGVDWEAVGEKYRRLIPQVGNRDDLNYLIGEMIGELNVGHTYISGGDRVDQANRISIGLLGADYDSTGNAGFHRVKHIIPGDPYDPGARSPLDEPGCPIKEGDYIIAVNGLELPLSENLYSRFVDLVGVPVSVMYNSAPSPDNAKTCRVVPIGSESRIRYQEWVRRNRQYVDEQSGGRIGYVHLPDMMTGGLIEFAKVVYPHYYKEAFVIDERYNGGGFTADMIMDRMERKLWALTQPREGNPIRDPERVFHGEYAVIINERTGSNGEYFAEAVKRKNLAKVIGRRTWGGAIGIEPHQPLVDGGVTTPPQFGIFGLEGEWLIEGHGVVPHLDVQNWPEEVISGKDAQLDAALDYLKNRLNTNPPKIPKTPSYPNKSKQVQGTNTD
jgi:tricorn protease